MNKVDTQPEEFETLAQQLESLDIEYRSKHSAELSAERAHERKVKIIKRIGLTAVGLAFMGGIFAAAKAEQANSPEVQAQRIEQEFFREAKSEQLRVLPKTVILGEGVDIRSTPARFIDDPKSSNNYVNVDNVLYQVEAGKNVVVENPALFYDNGSEWIAFKFAKGKEIEEEWAFVNMKQGQDQTTLPEISNESLITIIQQRDATLKQVKPRRYEAFINKDGGLEELMPIYGDSEPYAHSRIIDDSKRDHFIANAQQPN